MASEKYKRQYTVPVGVWTSLVSLPADQERHPYEACFIGHIIKTQGVQLVLEAIPLITKQIKNFHFVVIGAGEYLPTLKQITKKLSIQKYVTFPGKVKKLENVYEIMKMASVSVATYTKYDEYGKLNFSNFADPSKLKDYMVCGLPIVMTDVPPNAKELASQQCAFLVKPNPDSIAKMLDSSLEDP